jgi:CysZ protein
MEPLGLKAFDPPMTTPEEPIDNVVEQAMLVPGGFVAGFTYPFRALIFLQRSPQLWPCVLVPIVINLLLGVGLYIGLLFPAWGAIDLWTSGLPQGLAQWLTHTPDRVAQALAWLPVWAGVVDDVLRWVLAAALLIVTGLLLVQFGAILGAPWYGNLAEQIERLRVGQLPPAPMNLAVALRDIGRAIAFQVKKLFLAIVLLIPLLLCNFVPVLGSGVASMGGTLLAALLVCLDFLDAPLERRKLSFRHKLSLVGRTLPASLSFSLVCLGLVSMPFLNLLAVPLCVVAGTLFSCDRILPKLSDTHS